MDEFDAIRPRSRATERRDPARSPAATGCERWQEALSALADGEDPGVDGLLVDAHVRRCAGCAGYAAVIGVSANAGRRDAAATNGRHAAIPSARRIAAAVARADRSGHSPTVRALLAVVAAEVIVLSLPDLVRRGEASEVHEARHLGAFAVAYGVALLVVVLRPARARAVLPAAAVVACALTITAVVDLAQGRIPLLGEALHLPEIVSVVLVWSLARQPPLAAGTYSRHG